MGLADKVTTLGGMLSRADKTCEPYEFLDVEPGRSDPRVVNIPVSLDQKRSTLRQMLNHRIEIEAERARLEIELESIEREIKKHQIEFSKEMLLLNIPAPMAKEDLPTPPAIPTSEVK